MPSITINSISAYSDVLNSISAYDSISRAREGLDFSSFANFVWFGSARFEVDNSVLDIQENYPNFDKWGINSSNLAVTADDDIVSHYLSWKNSTDPFTAYLANDIAQYTVTATITGASYATGLNSTYTYTFPWFDYNDPFTSTQNSEISAWEDLGDSYDKTNINSILKMVSEYATDKDETLKTVLQIVGHHFDNFYISTKRHLDVYNFSYKFEEMPSHEVLNAFIDSLGMGKFYQFTESNLLDYYTDIYSGNEYSKRDFSKLMKIIFINNIMKVIKSKGTGEAIKHAEHMFGWPEKLVNVEEYLSVADNAPASGFTFHVPEVSQETHMLHGAGAPYAFQSRWDGSSLTAFSLSNRNSVIFTFAMSGISQVLSGGESYASEPIFRFYTEQIVNYNPHYQFSASGAISGFVLIYLNDSQDEEKYWAFPLTADKWSNVTDNTIFTLGFDVASKAAATAFLGTYNPLNSFALTNTDPSAVSGGVSGSVIYDEHAGVGSQSESDSKVYKLDFMQTSNGTNFIPIEWKLYERSLSYGASNFTGYADAAIHHIMDHNTIYRNNSSTALTDTPKAWYRFNNFHQTSLTSIPNSTPWYRDEPEISRLPLTTLNTGTLYLVDIPVVKNKEITFNAGDVVDEIGVYPEVGELNYLKSSNKLKVYVSPTKAMNNLIGNLIVINNLTNVYGKPGDLYEKKYSVLTELQKVVYDFLSNYTTASGLPDLVSFFDVIRQGYSENVIDFIVDNLVPAKSNVVKGLFLENDVLNDEKYQWKRMQPEDLVLEDDVDSRATKSAEDLQLISTKFVPFTKSGEQETDEAVDNNPPIPSSETSYDFTTALHPSVDTGADENEGEDEIYHASQVASTSVYEHIYWYSPLTVWDPLREFQGNELNTCSITGSYLYGKSKWVNPSMSTISASGFSSEIAHIDQSELVFSSNKVELFSESDFGQLHFDLIRYGFSSPGAFVKIKVPAKSGSNSAPIIVLSGMTESDVVDSTSGEYSFKLGDTGRTVSYRLNIDSTSSAYSQAGTTVSFGALGPSTALETITMPIQATLENRGSAGNGMIVNIVLDEDLQSTYAKAEVDNDRTLTIRVSESPYVVWGIIDAITGNAKAMDLFSVDVSSLQTVRASGEEDDYRTKTFGKYYLEGGDDDTYEIKNREYAIQLINIYNNNENIKSFTIVPKSKSTRVDESKDQNNW